MKKYQGSISVEAAAVLPLFIIGMMSLISINMMLIFQLKMQQALYNEARNLSMSCIDGHSEAISTISGIVVDELIEMNTNFSVVKDGRGGFSFDESNLDDPEYKEIIVEYSFLPFGFDLFDFVEIPVCQKSVIHVWNGYDKGYLGNQDIDYVYVAEGSEVYHINRECSHIRLSIKKVTGEEIGSLRNDDGGKYYSCELCHSKASDKDLYITTDGTKYHNKISCSGLKRSVRAVKLEDVGTRRPCKRCGNR